MLNWTPPAHPVSADAFSKPFKALALAIVLVAWVWGFQLWRAGVLVPTLQSSGWVLAALAMMSFTAWYVVVGRTTLDATCLQQRWVWHKQVQINDLAYAKLVHVRGLEWLIAPRLYTKSHAGKLAVFYTADPNLLNHLEALQIALRQATYPTHAP